VTGILGAGAFAGIGVAGGDGRDVGDDKRDLSGARHTSAIVEPALVAASERVEERRAVEELGRAVLERTMAEKATRESIWDRIAACETQGDWSMRGPAFSGGVGFSNAAWDDWGGREFAPNAGQATREQQIIVAERIRSSVGFEAWGCAKRFGLTGR
jgi:Transglycosylase-like domain